MAAKLNKTVKYEASNLSKAPTNRGKKPTIGISRVKSRSKKIIFSVTMEGKVYAIPAHDAKEAAYKANLIHYNKKEK
jgi:hypothetical protein